MAEAARAALADGCAIWANPSSPHAEGRAAKRALEEARASIARSLGWTHDVLFTSGASESLAIALTRSMAERRFVGAIDHDAVLRAAPDAIVMPVGPDGVLQLPDLSGPRAVVTVQWANSETGVRQPIAELAEAIHAAGHILLVDAAQMPAGADTEVIAHADLVALSAHKRGGPPG
ncbi:MAG TPA: aminotransferase class V-fold PLP-dependent enzyme, partial [Sphingomonas sanguinis]|nr:aminotransferase class V-fold PLP-dependent enzyme [Sphingomonas sanguinis]